MLVALLAHAVLFGHGHAFAGASEPDTYAVLGTTLALLFLGAVAAAALERRRTLAARDAFRDRLTLALELISGGASALAAVEALEGHGLGVLTSGAILVVVPIAALVVAGALAALAWARRIGSALAGTHRSDFERVIRFARPAQPLAPVFVVAAARRGRAPPRRRR